MAINGYCPLLACDKRRVEVRLLDGIDACHLLGREVACLVTKGIAEIRGNILDALHGNGIGVLREAGYLVAQVHQIAHTLAHRLHAVLGEFLLGGRNRLL